LDFVVVVAWVFGKTGTALPVNSRWVDLDFASKNGDVTHGSSHHLEFGKIHG